MSDYIRNWLIQANGENVNNWITKCNNETITPIEQAICGIKQLVGVQNTQVSLYGAGGESGPNSMFNRMVIVKNGVSNGSPAAFRLLHLYNEPAFYLIWNQYTLSSLMFGNNSAPDVAVPSGLHLVFTDGNTRILVR